MGWLGPIPTGGGDGLDAVLALSPAGTAFGRYRDAVWGDVAADPLLLELCRLRMAQLLGREPHDLARHAEAVTAGLTDAHVDALSRWPEAGVFSERQRAALAFAEQWLLDPHAVSDDDCARVRDHLTDAECAAFTMGLAVVEAVLRLEAVLGVAERPTCPEGA
jgi:alkylhydroperoxidase family enzyme